jgi:glycosyltransferase involved in cell wall biosynthesis
LFFSNKKIIFLAKTSWNYYLHPYRTLYAKELSTCNNQVFWINEPTRNPAEFIRQFFSAGKLLKNLKIFTPLLFSPTLHNLNSFNSWILKIQLFILCGTLNSQDALLWSVYCHHEKIVKHYPKAYKIYWPGDLFDLDSERAILSFYDLVMPLTEESILNLKKFYYGKSFLSTTGCDWTLFDQEFQKNTKTNYKVGNKPIVGYVGNISSFRLDFEVLKELVFNSTNWEFTFYGPIEQDRETLKSVDELSSFENCNFAGELNYDQIPSAIVSFTAGIIPYKLNKFNLGTNPNKFFEYSAMGVPCISSRIPSLEKFSEFIVFADSAKDWIHGIEKSIHSSKVNVDDLRKVAYLHSPNESLKRLEETILQT